MSDTNDILTWLKTVRGSYAGKVIDLIEQQQDQVDILIESNHTGLNQLEQAQQRIAELEAENDRLSEENPNMAENIELRKAVGIYTENSKTYRKRIAELEAEVEQLRLLVVY